MVCIPDLPSPSLISLYPYIIFSSPVGTLPLSTLILSSASFLLFPALPYMPIFLFGVYLFHFSTNSCLCLLQSPAGNTILHWLTSTISFISWPQHKRAIWSMLLCICWDAISYKCLTLLPHGVLLSRIGEINVAPIRFQSHVLGSTHLTQQALH